MKGAVFFTCLIFSSLVFSQKLDATPSFSDQKRVSSSEVDSETNSSASEIDYKNVDDVYLKGAVPEENKKVVFRYSVPTFSQPEKKVFDALQSWGGRLQASTKIYQLYADSTKHEIALLVEDQLQFKSSRYYVEKATISFNLLLKVYPERCEVIVRDIKYNYIEAHKNIEAKAENMITDKVALSKNGQLSRYYDKFRVHTLDLIWNVQDQVQDRIVGNKIENIKEFKKVLQVPGRLSSLLASDLALLTFVSEKVENIRLKEGDADLNEDGSIIYLTKKASLKSGDIFTLSFYTEAYRDMLDKLSLSQIRTSSGGLSHPEAWMIIECQMIDEGEKDRVEGKILSVWIK